MITAVISMLVLACAVSLDGFGVGVTYGLRKIRIPLMSVIIIACCSGLIIWLSMQAGVWLTSYLSETTATIIGALLLVAIGCWALFQLRGNRAGSGAEAPHEKGHQEEPEREGVSDPMVLRLELKQLGLVIQILRSPQTADVDRSGIISPSEAVMLGTALSLDAFGAGLGAAMLGLPALVTALLIAVCSAIFLICGVRIGIRFADWKGMQVVSFAPGVLLIIMGIMKLL